MNTKNQENGVAKLRERFYDIKKSRKPSKIIEETFIAPVKKEKEEKARKKIARSPEADI